MATAPSEPVNWRAGIDADRRKRRRRIGNQREALRSLTVATAIAAAGLNAVLFVQTGVGQVDAGNVDGAIVSFINGLFPRSGLQPPSQAPTTAPRASPIATTGGS